MKTAKQSQKPENKNRDSESFDYTSRLNEISSKISDITRSSSLGLIAVAWLGLSAKDDSPKVVLELDEVWLMVGAGIALVALFLDFMQYVFGYFAVLRDKERKEGLKLPHRKTMLRKARFFCFYAKIFSAITSSIILIIAVSEAVLKA